MKKKMFFSIISILCCWIFYSTGTSADTPVSLSDPSIREGARIRSVLSADPESLDFGTVNAGDERDITTTVTLTNPLKPLDIDKFSHKEDGIFTLLSVEPLSSTPEADIAFITVAFAPPEEGDFENALIVHTTDAEDLKIPLTGSGERVTAPQPVSGTERAMAPVVSVREGELLVSLAPAGSSIQVYNLQGQVLKTLVSTSGLVEILKTASFPQSVYIVIKDSRNQEILKQKVETVHAPSLR
jgi:hypothetical protein